MPDSEKVDLSKLRIQRENTLSGGSQTPGARPRTGLVLYVAGGLFLALSLVFFIRTALTSAVEVELTTVMLISPTQAQPVLTASGYVVAQRKAAIASKATGRLVYLGFQEGDKVKEGKIIARIESADVEAALAQARADLEVARAELNDARRSSERAGQLLARNLISQAEEDAARGRLDRVVASIASREAAVKAAEVGLENTRIRAPFDGTILTKNADIGEVVAPFAAGSSSRVAVVTIADMGSLEVEADVSESNIQRISPGQPCEITLDAYPERRYRGVVDKVVPTADRAKATVLTKVRFLERDSSVLPEMGAKVHFLAPASHDEGAGGVSAPVLAVDPGAVASRNGRKVVFAVRDDDSVTEEAVETGRTIGQFVEVTRGLRQGEKVVLRPGEKLESGSKIRLRQP